jgi:hypothetical protein
LRGSSKRRCEGTVWFNVNGTDYDEFDDPDTAYAEPYTKFDQAFKPPDPIPSAGWTLLSNRGLVNKAILSWATKNIIGTDLTIGQASLPMGGHYALLMLAWSLGIGVFIYIASLLLGLGVPLFYLLSIAAGLGIVGLVSGLLEPLYCHEEGDYDMTMMGLFPIIYADQRTQPVSAAHPTRCLGPWLRRPGHGDQL